MSTVPGSDAWRDAGLEPVTTDEPTRLTDDLAPPDPDEYVPGFPRPDLDGGADEADVVEQDSEVALDDDGGDA
ncbi:hypothetical protein [Cellulomonas edaphi]|uniref:Chromosome partitioning protein n=1 Tax=Cellulomonas edaphi TaxID=3053468 RepID=A0ABT7S5G1_9CELL|nr:hypothetical protein [Cellulomons edaphi]MDM7830840.1 hypothetical protein [Cellulomons edaphi]